MICHHKYTSTADLTTAYLDNGFSGDDLFKIGQSIANEEYHVGIPTELVHQAIASAPANITVYNRDAVPVMDLGGRRAYFGTGSDLIYALDSPAPIASMTAPITAPRPLPGTSSGPSGNVWRRSNLMTKQPISDIA